MALHEHVQRNGASTSMELHSHQYSVKIDEKMRAYALIMV
jgi:hypothetical protein